MTRITEKICFLCRAGGSVTLLLAATNLCAAGFTLNFTSNGTQIIPGANASLGSVGGGTGIGNSGKDGTGMINEKVNIGGKDYFHVVIQDANSAFKEEYYTAAVTANTDNKGGAPRAYSPLGGGNERSFIGNKSVVKTINAGPWLWPKTRFGNAKSPFGSRLFADHNDTTGTAVPIANRYRLSGNGTMDPTRTVLLMQMSDSTVSVEVYKPFLNRKPKISQTLTEGGLTSQFVADLRSLTYADLKRVVPIVNTLSLNDPNLPTPGVADFDISFSQKPHVSAGQFTFSGAGQGWVDATTGAPVAGWDNNNSKFNPGTYQYAEGNFDVLKVNWAAFFDPTQNPNSQVNVTP